MQIINSAADLRVAILQLESLQNVEREELKMQFNLAYESIKPINLIKSTFKEVGEYQGLTDQIISTSTGLVVGYLSKVLFERTSDSPAKKLFGTVLQFGITNLIANNPDAVKTVATGIIKIVKSFSAGDHEADSNDEDKI
ncbi:MAG: hypothetical protein HUU01_08170 [Saprospiraceae bacterium]|nr:hypothetical protein [Saprospiraceae bacterium]